MKAMRRALTVNGWARAVLLMMLAASLPAAAAVQVSPEGEVAWVCPMHPDYTQDREGTCPRCGMTLIRSYPYDTRDYRLELRTRPAVPRPGEPTNLQFTISHPGTGEQVTGFETVHTQRYHLFVISQDMEFFEHVHPAQLPDGSWSMDLVLPKAGYYKILSDFMPSGGSAQFLARPLVTTSYDGDLTGDSPRLIPDTELTKTVGDITATLSLDPTRFQSGLYGHLAFFLTDARTGQPVTDLQPYLGSYGHTLIMSEDLVDYVHAHPIDLQAIDDDYGPRQVMIPADADPSTLHGGPEVVFEGLMPSPGGYRAWTQFMRNDQLHTFAFTFEVE
jgi:hypothetical protein